MKFEFSTKSLDSISSDALIIFAFASTDKKKSYLPLESFTTVDSLLSGQVTKVCDLEKFKGKRGQMVTVIPSDKFASSRILVLGLGKKEEFVADDLRRVMGAITKKYRSSVDSFAIMLPSDNEVTLDNSSRAFVVGEGILLGSYEFIKYKSKEKGERALATIIIAEKNETIQKELKKGFEKAELFAQATRLTRDLVNEQPAFATPTYLANLAQDIAKGSPLITCKIYDKEQCEKMGMDAFLGIARASDTPPKFIHLEYTPAKNTSKEKLALVGKGITFDSGGINVKPGDYMSDMKMDMSGAAIVLGVFSVIAHIKPDVPVIGLIAATPNLISGSSIVPGDVVKAMNGKTIEVLNTDAEGRVTMADSLSYAVKEKATKIIDFATLTGACMVALGVDISGLFSNDRNLAEEIKSAAFTAGEKVWELPLEKEYKTMNKSDVADIANIPNSRYGGALTAALFLEEFVDNTPWAHLDIAGPAFANKPSDISQKGGTGHGVRTVLTMLSK